MQYQFLFRASYETYHFTTMGVDEKDSLSKQMYVLILLYPFFSTLVRVIREIVLSSLGKIVNLYTLFWNSIGGHNLAYLPSPVGCPTYRNSISSSRIIGLLFRSPLLNLSSSRSTRLQILYVISSSYARPLMSQIKETKWHEPFYLLYIKNS